MKLHKWFNYDIEEWSIVFRIKLYLNPFAFFFEIELLCFRIGFFVYNDNIKDK